VTGEEKVQVYIYIYSSEDTYTSTWQTRQQSV